MRTPVWTPPRPSLPLRRLLPWLVAALVATAAAAQESQGADVEVTSEGRAYASYLAAPTASGPWPGIVLIHSFNGLEPGYRALADEVAAEGFVVLAVGWQSFERQPPDATVAQLVRDAVDVLRARDDVDPARLGLTGFCAGGRYTMLLLPQIDAFGAGVAWYGFPYGGDTPPASLADRLEAPLLMIHGSADQPSPIGELYRYAGELDAAGASYELKVYQGEPHGFLLEGGELRDDEVAADAVREMVDFFRRKL